MHITASVFISDDESGLRHDYEVWLEQLAPHEPVGQYWHNRTGEDNADAHLKRQVMGREVVVTVTNGKLDFGPWEQILYAFRGCGFDTCTCVRCKCTQRTLHFDKLSASLNHHLIQLVE